MVILIEIVIWFEQTILMEIVILLAIVVFIEKVILLEIVILLCLVIFDKIRKMIFVAK